jgi:hypothetical protein
MADNLIIYEAEPALLTPKGRNYKLNIGNTQTILKRDIDFGIIPGTQRPSLYKSGAEAIAMGYGLLQHYELVSSIENWDGEVPFFMYTVKCSLCKVVDGKEYVFSSAYGSANTKEKRNGRNDAFNASNSTLKMAQKRALTSAAIAVSGLSSAFTMDIEDSGFNRSVENMTYDTTNPDDKITTAQGKRLFAIAKTYGLGNVELKAWLKDKFGLESTKDITQKQYDDVVAELQKGN